MTIKFERLWGMILLLCFLQSCDKDSLGDVNGAPVAHGDTFSVKEDVDDQTIIGTIEATDPNGDVLTFDIRSGGNALFEINSDGEISLAEGKYLDYETVKEHSLVVMVSDGIIDRFRGVSVKVEDVDEIIADDPAAFVTTWKTDAANQTIYIGANEVYDYDFTIDWGDGTVENISKNSPQLFEHTFSTAGNYTVAIIGDFPSINMNKVYQMYGDEPLSRMVALEQWGKTQWKNLEGAFANCYKMKYNATDVPNLELANSLAGMFLQTSFNADINDWDTSNITDMRLMFYNNSKFNQDLNKWNTSKVTSMEGMFLGAIAFNGDISTWNTSKVTTMLSMFDSATSFNGDLSNWDISNAVNTSGMFFGTVLFNADIGGWDTSNVVDMSGMFSGATSFDQDLGNWDIGNVITMENMLNNSGLSKNNINATLIGWNGFVQQNTGPIGIELGLEGLTICGVEAYSAVVELSTIYTWVFTGEASIQEQCN